MYTFLSFFDLGVGHGNVAGPKRMPLKILIPSSGKYISFEVKQKSTGVAFFPAVVVLSAQLMVHKPNPITYLPTVQKAAAHCCL